MSKSMNLVSRRSLGIAVALVATLALLAAAQPVSAAPCCQTCDGWPEPPGVPDSCWQYCVICGGSGYECDGPADCGPLQQCINGWCTYGLLTTTTPALDELAPLNPQG